MYPSSRTVVETNCKNNNKKCKSQHEESLVAPQTIIKTTLLLPLAPVSRYQFASGLLKGGEIKKLIIIIISNKILQFFHKP